MCRTQVLKTNDSFLLATTIIWSNEPLPWVATISTSKYQLIRVIDLGIEEDNLKKTPQTNATIPWSALELFNYWTTILRSGKLNRGKWEALKDRLWSLRKSLGRNSNTYHNGESTIYSFLEPNMLMYSLLGYLNHKLPK